MLQQQRSFTAANVIRQERHQEFNKRVLFNETNDLVVVAQEQRLQRQSGTVAVRVAF